MNCTIRDALVFENGQMNRRDFSFEASGVSGELFHGLAVFPGFADVHVHFREPGFSYKETIYTGSRAAARGGYAAALTLAGRLCFLSLRSP